MLRVTNCYFCIFCFHQKYFAKCVTQSINNDNLNFSTYFSRHFPTLKIQKICNFLVLAMSRKVTFLMYPFICWKLYHLFLMELIFQYEKIKCFAFLRPRFWNAYKESLSLLTEKSDTSSLRSLPIQVFNVLNISCKSFTGISF